MPSGPACLRDKPDILLRYGAGFLGIEITDYFRATTSGARPMQEQEALRWRIVKEAQRLFEASAGVPLHVSVHFGHGAIDKSNVATLAKRLAQLVAEAPVRSGQVIRVPEQAWIVPPRPFHALNILQYDGAEKGSWVVPDAAFVPEIGPQQIQAILDRKNGIVADYRSTARDLWLVVVASGLGMSSTVTFGSAARTHVYTSYFDRTFYFDYFVGKAQVLTCTR